MKFKDFDEFGLTHIRDTTPKYDDLVQKVINILKYSSVAYPGKRIKAARIAAAIHTSQVKVNAMIRDLRLSNYPICSDAKGYWYSKDPDDITNTISHLENRNKAIILAIVSLSKHLPKKGGYSYVD